MQAANKGYVDTQVATSLPLSGGILSGPLTLAADPTSALQATTKEYADTKLARSGDTLSGLLTLSGAPVNPYHAAPKTYVDTQILTVLPKAGGAFPRFIAVIPLPQLPFWRMDFPVKVGFRLAMH